VHHVQTVDDLSEEWFNEADMVGITAGTSTPDAVIAAIEAKLKAYCLNTNHVPQPA
jgi:4-hydroxy-3-methylbut-2-enyl diphosphate reductase